MTARGLQVGYRRAILPPIDLEIRRGRMLLVLGRNGSGKTTLMRTLLGLLPPIAGALDWQAGLRRAFVPQSGAIDAGVPVRAGDVASWGRMRGWSFLWPLPRRGDRAATIASLRALEVERLRHQPLRDLSGGQVQRVLFARMLAGDTDVAVLDEPTAAMDGAGERAVYKTLRALARDRGIAVVVVTHAVSAALRTADQVLLLDPDTSAGGGDARDDAAAVAAGHSPGRILLGPPEQVMHDETFRSLFGVTAGFEKLEAADVA
ncbi:MAG: ATP-binding cassette domain-containing protein [Kofleriaceae bacterium]|nr:ATP-binding cassette domain-containing protein [Myxococcales bacterium]MCB9561087.1 ATP-binding cassette domain-containing protein [Kofleriaceae bacterium]MCB9573443.1 ATP-binding cassette domain-containing protein [Kofleriaceae bacterium]MCB9575352.1 ATP-binding cassette domain-containing protein [Kofleriaceae bacterium]